MTIKKRTQRRSRSRLITRDVTVKSLTLKATRAGVVSRSFKTLSAGSYRLTFRTTDAAGNIESRTLAFTVRTAEKAAKKAS